MSASRYAATALGGPIDLAAAILDDTRDLVGVRAACAGRHALFEPSPVTEPRDEREFRRDAALALCAACPALAACRGWVDRQPRRHWAGWVVGGRFFPSTGTAPLDGAA